MNSPEINHENEDNNDNTTTLEIDGEAKNPGFEHVKFIIDDRAFNNEIVDFDVTRNHNSWM